MENAIKIPQEYRYICAFISMRCNLDCSFCLNSLDNSKDFNRLKFKEIPGEDWIKALNRIKTRPGVPITFSGGEASLHKDFVSIINGLKKELDIDILTNLKWSESMIRKFIDQVDPDRLKRDSPYESIRVSYHPEEMGDGSKLIEGVKKLKDAGFSIGVWSVLFPTPQQLSAINQMQFRCKDLGIEYRLKEYVGVYKGAVYGNYSRFPGAVVLNKFDEKNEIKNCLCKTSELLIGPNGNAYKCHRDLYNEEFQIGNITNSDFNVISEFRVCTKFGECHSCDVKVKTDYKQKLGHTSVIIKDVKEQIVNNLVQIRNVA